MGLDVKPITAEKLAEILLRTSAIGSSIKPDCGVMRNLTGRIEKKEDIGRYQSHA
jgi:hypothetical protein